MGLPEIALLAIAIALAAGAQGITGFGFAILASPLLVLVLPIEVAIPTAVVLSLLPYRQSRWVMVGGEATCHVTVPIFLLRLLGVGEG